MEQEVQRRRRLEARGCCPSPWAPFPSSPSSLLSFLISSSAFSLSYFSSSMDSLRMASSIYGNNYSILHTAASFFSSQVKNHKILPLHIAMWSQSPVFLMNYHCSKVQKYLIPFGYIKRQIQEHLVILFQTQKPQSTKYPPRTVRVITGYL